MKNGYTLAEVLFSNRWRWVRRISGVRWVRMREPGYVWVKVDADPDLRSMFARLQMPDAKYEIEDWRRRQ